MSFPDDTHDLLELRLAGRDECWRPVYILTVVAGDSRVMVWDGTSLDEARAAARFWQDDGIQVVDLVPSGAVH